jgi:hypothetical protein
VWFVGLYGRYKAEAKYHCDTSDSENTDHEELMTTVPRWRQRTSPNVGVVQTPNPSNNNSGPIPANPLSTPGKHAEPARADTSLAPVLNHLLHLQWSPTCSARQEAPKRQRLNPALPHDTAAPPVLPEQLVKIDHDPLSEPQPATSTAIGKALSGAAAEDKARAPNQNS